MRFAMFPRGLCLLLPLLLLLTLAAFGCATRTAPKAAPAAARETAETSKEEQIWQRFRTRAAAAENMTGPFRIAANLRYTDAEGKTNRVSVLFWGNGQAGSPYPLRLDLLAGVGSVVAKAREDERSFSIFVPEEKTVYAHEGDSGTLASFGVPIPLSLGDLSLLLTGRSGALFLPASVHNDTLTPPEHSLTPQGARFTVTDSRLPGVLELSDTGAPLSWSELQGKGWTIALEPGATNPLQPSRVRISHPGGYSALVVLKELERVSPPYSAARLALELPPGTNKKPLTE